MAHSNRKYHIVMLHSEGEGEPESIKLTLNRLMEERELGSEPEYIYALQDRIDEIIDLKVKEIMYFNPCRDISNIEKGMIKRIN